MVMAKNAEEAIALSAFGWFEVVSATEKLHLEFLLTGPFFNNKRPADSPSAGLHNCQPSLYSLCANSQNSHSKHYPYHNVYLFINE